MIKNNLVLISLCLLVFSACKKESRDLKAVQDDEIKVALGAQINNYSKDTSGIYYQILNAPTGDSLKNSDLIFYTQTLKLLNGKELSSNKKYNYNTTYLGYINPIGFRKSIFAMIKAGGKIHTIIPSYLAFGKNGSGSQIPGNSIIDATFEVFNAKNAIDAEDTIITRFKNTLNLDFIRDASGVYYHIIQPGDEAGEEVLLSSTISANYTGKFFNGEQFDASASGSPLTTVLGTGVIKGWRVLSKIKKGGKIRLLIPSHQGYGSSGNGSISPNTPLDFEIELTEVKNN